MARCYDHQARKQNGLKKLDDKTMKIGRRKLRDPVDQSVGLQVGTKNMLMHLEPIGIHAGNQEAQHRNPEKMVSKTHGLRTAPLFRSYNGRKEIPQSVYQQKNHADDKGAVH